MFKKIVICLLIILIIGIAAGYYFGYDHGWERAVENVPSERDREADQEQEFLERHASFLIFTNGTRRVFTAAMYHNLSEDVFIEAGNPAVVHVKKIGITWQGFFDTLPVELSKTCLVTGTKETFCNTTTRSLKFFLNGERVENFLDMEIQHGDWALISYGIENEAQIASELEQARKISEQN